MSNIPGLNQEESEWVVNWMKACSEGKSFSEHPPSDKCIDRIEHNLKEIGLLDE